MFNVVNFGAETRDLTDYNLRAYLNVAELVPEAWGFPHEAAASIPDGLHASREQERQYS